MLKNIMVANWKMNKTVDETFKFFEYLNVTIKEECIICVPFINLGIALKSNKNAKINIGAQNCFWEDYGAFTGEVSAKMLSDVGVSHVIIGHSERRILFFENDKMINKKIIAALDCGLKVIFCVGESSLERGKNIQNQAVINQIKLGLSGIKDISNIIIAYEPIWAIGTGNTCSAAEAESVCREIRNFVKSEFGKDKSYNLKILYGGSMNVRNAEEFLQCKNINGGLIGGASLDAEKFLKLTNLCKT